MPRPLTFDHLRSAKKGNTKVVSIVLDPDLADELTEAQQRFEKAKLLLEAQPKERGRYEEYEDSEAALEKVRARVEEAGAIAEIKVRGIGRQRYDKLQADHPPTEEQRKKHKRENPEQPPLTENPDTFPIALIAACAVEPTMTVEQVKELWDSDEWNLAECMTLMMACIEVNQQRRIASLGKGSG